MDAFDLENARVLHRPRKLKNDYQLRLIIRSYKF